MRSVHAPCGWEISGEFDLAMLGPTLVSVSNKQATYFARGSAYGGNATDVPTTAYGSVDSVDTTAEFVLLDSNHLSVDVDIGRLVA